MTLFISRIVTNILVVILGLLRKQQNFHFELFLFDLSLFLFPFSLKEFLPQAYIKNNKIEKRILSEHKKLFGTQEIDAKVGTVEKC